MNLRKNMVLLVSAAVTLVLVVVAVVFLVRFQGRYSRVAGSLQDQLAQLDRLRSRDPFPNTDNVALAEENHRRVEAAFDSLMGALSSDQFEAPDMEPAQFPLLLQRVLGGLNAVAVTNQVAVPPRFPYGFERYARQLPKKQHIPRLASQLNFIEAVCRALFATQVRDLTAVKRYVFEDAEGADLDGAGGGPFAMQGADPFAVRPDTAAGPAPGAAGAALGPGYVEEAHGLYTAERMVFSFSTGEIGVWDALNALASMDTFCRVTRLEIKSEAPTASPASLPGGPGPAGPMGAPVGAVPGMWPMEPGGMMPGMAGGTNAPVRITSREERVMAGKSELVSVELEVELFHFGPPPSVTNEENAL